MRFRLPKWLVLLLIVVFLIRIPSLFEPYYYGDEMIYLVLGQGVRQGLVLYKSLHDNKPPLLYFTAAIAENMFWFRAILTAWTICSVTLFWKFANTVFQKNKQIVKVATVFFAITTSIPIFEGQIANAELFMILPTIASVFLLYQYVSVKRLILAGVLLSIASLYKIPAAFDAFAIVLLIIMNNVEKKKWTVTKVVRDLFLFSVSFAVPILASIAFYYLAGAGKEYLVAAFLQNVGYVSSFRPQDQVDPFLVRNAPLLIRFAIMSISLLILFFLKRKLSKPFVVASAWIMTSLFAVTLSERPYPHYLIQALPAMSVLVGMLVASKRIEQAYTIIPLWITSMVIVFYSFWYYPIPNYIQRFAGVIHAQENPSAYRGLFGPTVERTYKLAQLINLTVAPNDRIFVWKDSAPVYALSRHLPPIKYTAGYHVDDFSSAEETVNALADTKPVLIILLPNEPTLANILQLLSKEYYLLTTIDGAEVWKKLPS